MSFASPRLWRVAWYIYILVLCVCGCVCLCLGSWVINECAFRYLFTYVCVCLVAKRAIINKLVSFRLFLLVRIVCARSEVGINFDRNLAYYWVCGRFFGIYICCLSLAAFYNNVSVWRGGAVYFVCNLFYFCLTMFRNRLTTHLLGFFVLCIFREHLLFAYFLYGSVGLCVFL